MRNISNAISSHTSDQSADELLCQFDGYITTLARNQFPYSINISDAFDLELDEIIQLTRIKLWSAYRQQHIHNIKAYIRTLVRNETVNIVRKYKKTQTLPVDKEGELFQGRVLMSMNESMEDPSSQFDQQETATECATAVARVVQTLPPRQRQAIICSLKENIDDIVPFLDASVVLTMNFETTNWPQEKGEAQSLKASLSIARKKLQAQLNLHAYELKMPPSSRKEQSSMDSDLSSGTEIPPSDAASFAVFLACISALPELYQPSVRLHYVEKCTYAEIAERLNIPVGTVKSHVSRGKKLVHELIKKKTDMNAFQSLSDAERQKVAFAEMEPFLHTLREPYQTVLRLHYGEGCHYPDIAGRVGAPVGTVKSYASRGMKMLRKTCPL